MTQIKSMKYATIAARILLGLVFFAGGLAYFFMGEMPLDLSTPAGKYASALLATGFFFPVLKVVEALAGLMLFFKRWTPLALIILAPIIVQIFLYNIFLDTAGLPISIVIMALAAFIAWQNWKKYAPLFAK